MAIRVSQRTILPARALRLPAARHRRGPHGQHRGAVERSRGQLDVRLPPPGRARDDRSLELKGGFALGGKGDTNKVVVSGHSYGGYTTLVSCGVSFDTETLMAQCEAGEGATKFCDGFNDDLAAVFEAAWAIPASSRSPHGAW